MSRHVPVHMSLVAVSDEQPTLAVKAFTAAVHASSPPPQRLLIVELYVVAVCIK